MHQEDQAHELRVRLLSNYGWLAGTSPTFIDAVIAQGRWKKVKVGDRVTTAGEEKSELIALAESSLPLLGFIATVRRQRV